MNINIQSDGTKAGTTVLVNGSQVENMRSIEFYMDSYSSNPSMSYSVREQDKTTHVQTDTYFRYDPSIAKVVATDEKGEQTVDAEDYKKM